VHASECVVTITGINSPSFVTNASTKIVWVFLDDFKAADGCDYIVTIGGIERANVENAVFTPLPLIYRCQQEY
jgi:hypothetical protein